MRGGRSGRTGDRLEDEEDGHNAAEGNMLMECAVQLTHTSAQLAQPALCLAQILFRPLRDIIRAR